ncbi:MAG: Bax inhibitor-1/YccA family protein [Cellulomonadaceae bacterium]
MSNPVFGSNDVFADPVQRRGRKQAPANPYASTPTPDAGTLDQMYAAPTATPRDTGRLTYDDVIVKTGGLLALLVVVAAATWMTFDAAPGLYIVGAIVGFVLAMVNIFKKQPSPALITAYTVAQGVFLGGLSASLDRIYPGVALQALLATTVTVAVTLLLFTSGKVRATPKATKIFLVLMLSYLAFSLVNLGIMIFGSSDAAWGLRTSVTVFGIPLGVVLGIVAVLLAAYSLVLDFDSIQRGVREGAPAKFAWTAAFGLIVTLVWLYVEFLRIFAILAGRD